MVDYAGPARRRRRLFPRSQASASSGHTFISALGTLVVILISEMFFTSQDGCTSQGRTLGKNKATKRLAGVACMLVEPLIEG